MGEEKDFEDELVIIGEKRDTRTSPIVEEPASIMEMIASESERLALDRVWNMPHALALIAFRDKKRITDTSWSWRHPREPKPAVENPLRVLLDWLFDGKITASIDGDEKDKRFWDNVETYNLLKEYLHACFRRDDLLNLVFPDGATAPLSIAKPRGGRPAKIDWSVVASEVSRLMEYHGPFSVDDPDWNCKARLEAAVKSFIDQKFGPEAIRSEDTIRRRVTEFLKKPEAEK